MFKHLLKFCPKQRCCCDLGLREASIQLPHWGSKLEISSKPQVWNMKARKKYITLQYWVWSVIAYLASLFPLLLPSTQSHRNQPFNQKSLTRWRLILHLIESTTWKLVLDWRKNSFACLLSFSIAGYNTLTIHRFLSVFFVHGLSCICHLSQVI